MKAKKIISRAFWTESELTLLTSEYSSTPTKALAWGLEVAMRSEKEPT